MLTLEQYSENHTTPLDPIQEEVLTYTEANHKEAHMLSGRLQGQLLRQMVFFLKPKLVLEIGTMTGFSALCMASALPKGGELHTLEKRETDAQLAQSFFDKTSYGKKIHLHLGKALETLNKFSKPWEFVYLDADKPGYIDYYEALLKTMKPNSIILADNVHFHGSVLSSPLKGKNAKAIVAFNQHVMKDERVEVIMLPVRDGLSLIRIRN